MTVLELLLLAGGLAMDATAVAASLGMASPGASWQAALRIGAVLGASAATFPAVGYVAGAWLGPRIAAYDHWVAFGVLAFLGLGQVWSGLRDGGAGELVRAAVAGRAPVGDTAEPQATQAGVGISLLALFGLAVATSLDTLAVGLTLPLMDAPLLGAMATIGGVTALGGTLGVHLGARMAARSGPRLEIVGGVILVLIGAKLLIEHLAT